jgi:dipeptidyl aminopeptidase/acylaminoacyl peptidase
MKKSEARSPKPEARPKSGERTGVVPEDLLELRYVGRPHISPDGRQVVFSRRHVGDKNEYVSDLWMVDADGRSAPAPFTNGGRDSQPRFSPDGRSVAFVRAREKEKPQIWLIAASGGEARVVTKFPEGSIRDFQWSPDGRHLAVAFRDQDEAWTEAARKAREAKGLSEPARVLDDWWYRLDGDGYFNAQRHGLFLVDVEGGEHRLLYDRDTLGDFSYAFSPDSRRLAIASNRDPKALIKPWMAELLLLDIAGGKLKALGGLPQGRKEQVAWSPNGRWLAFAGRTDGPDGTYGTENVQLLVCDWRHGGVRNLLAHTDYCLAAATLTDTGEVDFNARFEWAPDSKSLVVRLGWHGETHAARLAIDGKLVFLTRGPADHDLGNLSSSGRRAAFVRSTSTRPPEVFVGELSRRRARLRAITDFNGAWVRKRTLRPIESRWITSADGVKVQVWAMYPPGHGPEPARAGTQGSATVRRRRKRLPAVLEIHGGPHGQYGVGFFHEFQLLASRGFIVFFANPRGSKGYGREFCAAIQGAWGTTDWQDIQAVTAFMKDHPRVDARRLGVMGGSYGGYMTTWAIGHTHDFAAAITDRSVSNVVSLGATSDFVEEPDRYFPGNFWDRPETRWEQSPIKYLGNASTPTLIIHSEGDLRCNIEQAEQVFSALKLLDVETRFVRYPRSTSHGMSRGGPPDLRIHRLHQIVKWWEKHLKRR